MKITDLELSVIQNIGMNEFTPLNGGIPDCHHDAECWVDTVAGHGPHQIRLDQISGLMGSLSKKGMIWTNGTVCGLTEMGFQAFSNRGFSK